MVSMDKWVKLGKVLRLLLAWLTEKFPAYVTGGRGGYSILRCGVTLQRKLAYLNNYKVCVCVWGGGGGGNKIKHFFKVFLDFLSETYPSQLNKPCGSDFICLTF